MKIKNKEDLLYVNNKVASQVELKLILFILKYVRVSHQNPDNLYNVWSSPYSVYVFIDNYIW